MQLPYSGQGARIDLTSKTVRIEKLDKTVYRRYLGGKGLGALLLLNSVASFVDPLSPDNVLIFLTGPLTGSPFPSSSRGVVVTKSPLTKTFLDSNIGGGFGHALKSTGLDYLVIEGKSEKPVWLLVTDKGIEFRDAGSLWGRSTSQTEDSIRREMNDSTTKVAAIGQAGEREVLFASIACDRRMFGRGGSGTVMGSKNLKAIAMKGTFDAPWFRTDAFVKEAQKAREKIRENPGTTKGGSFPLYGTTSTMDATNTMGVLPTRNWQEGTFEGGERLYSNAFFAKKIKSSTCFQCPIACGRIVRTENDKGIEASSPMRGPEYETIYAFGANCGISDPEIVIKANYLCEEYGLDTISCGVVASFLMECAQKGIIDKHWGERLPVFGDAESLIETIKYIGEGGRAGNLLGQGVRRLAGEIGRGTERFAMSVKGLELPGYDPRGMKTMALLYATSDRGGCHVRGNTIRVELLAPPGSIDRFGYEGKAALAAGLHPIYAIMNSYSACLFSAAALTIDDYAGALSVLFATTVTPEELIGTGKRIWNLTRYFNCREGFSRDDDTLPARLFEDPIPHGPAKDQVIDRVRFEAMKDEYYELVGWDVATGLPMIDPDEYLM